jgi:ElaB/YqjD/DUF883 family membrane-anchored ribosome-binding protein
METSQDQIKERIADTISDTKDRVDDAINATSDKLFETAKKVEQVGDASKKAVSEYSEKTRDKLQESANYLKNTDVDTMADELMVSLKAAIRSRPLVSIGFALGTGYILARLFSKK